MSQRSVTGGQRPYLGCHHVILVFTPRGRPVPQSRLSRLARFGAAAAGVSGNMLVEGARRLLRREPFSLSDLLLTPANAARVTDQLARLRGAAMKIGQLISMDAGTVLPPELAGKVQYPGVRESIASDVDNVAALLRLSGLVPSAVELAPLLAEAKRQLHEEADYRHEAQCLERFGQLLAGEFRGRLNT